MKPTRTALVLLLVSSWAGVAVAGPPPGQFTLQFDGDAAIWNPFDGFQACETFTDLGFTETLCLNLDDVFCDGAGICVCYAAFEFSGIIDGVLDGPCNAKVSCNRTPDDPTDNECKARLALDASGSVSGAGVSCDAELSNFVVNGPVDYAGLYHGKAKSKLCLDCTNGVHDCGGVGGLFEYEVNPPIPWALTINVGPDPGNPNTLVGGATDNLGPFEYTAKGKYNPTTGESAITLTGVTEKVDPESVSQGAKVQLKQLLFQGSNVQAGTAKIKVQGNKINGTPVGP